MEQNYCIICGIGIPEGRMVCPLCEAEYPPDELEKVIQRCESVEKSLAAIQAAFDEMLSRWGEVASMDLHHKRKDPENALFFQEKDIDQG